MSDGLTAWADAVARTSASVRTRARRTVDILEPKDVRGLFMAAGNWMDATYRIPSGVWDRLEALRLVSSERVRARLSALTDLGYETRDVLRVEVARG